MEKAFARIIGLVLPFVEKSLYTKLPPEAAEHRSFEIQDENRQCECVAVPERMLWAIRFKFTSKDGTAWYYDVSLVREDDRLIFGMKIDTAFGADVKALQANLPLVESLLGCGLLAQGRPVTANLWLVNTPEDVQELVALLEAPYRSLPVIVKRLSLVFVTISLRFSSSASCGSSSRLSEVSRAVSPTAAS